MQFIIDGPDIPEALLQAHEEGRVIFFVGAGVSYPAGLPGFKGLVDEIYRISGTTRNKIEDSAYNENRFDTTIDLLEQRLPGKRQAVRKALVMALKPNLRKKGALDTHIALLQLARNRKGVFRLVTTNFDRIFEVAGKRTSQHINTFAAPMLPIPKNSRWNGLVYLHGLLPKQLNEDALNRLVVSSGDFGQAYLTERWAARFVSDLFQNYVVCFIGYSIGDPILRYMMDALAADRRLGESTSLAYALSDVKPGQEDQEIISWKAKGVIPVLYKVSSSADRHSALHRTVKAWAETYRDGILGKERIVSEYALTRPSVSTQQDDFVGRMLWALSDESGLPAKRFAEFNPAPSLDWLEPLSDNRFRHCDLIRFGISTNAEIDDKLCFSLIRRPAPHTHSAWMSLRTEWAPFGQWDKVIFQLARWLIRHLNNPELIIWLAQGGGQLHSRLIPLIERELDRFAQLEQQEHLSDIAEIRNNSPDAIPQPLMRILWRLLLTGRVKSPWRGLDFHFWKSRLKREGLTATLRMELRELLAPKIEIKKPFRWGDEDKNIGKPERLNQFIDWKLALTADDIDLSIRDLAKVDHWRDAVPLLLGDFQQALIYALDLLREMHEADDKHDRTYRDLPSISPHRQNRGFRNWVALIELLRDSWLVVRENDPARASRIAKDWFSCPYPCFKRLALFAASHDGCIAEKLWVNWLVSDDSWWLWSVNTNREVLRLLVLQGANLTAAGKSKIEKAILAGPPPQIFGDNIEPERMQFFVDARVWLYLEKLQSSGCALSKSSLKKLSDLALVYPKWKLAKDDRDEFSYWLSSSSDPDYENNREINLAPRNRNELINWLMQTASSQRAFYEDTWRDTCRTRFFHCAYALNDLARKKIWPNVRWSEALQAWSEENLVQRSWRFVAPIVRIMPNAVLKEITHSLTWWLETVSKSIDRHKNILIEVCKRVLALSNQNNVTSDEPLMDAINHPIGHVTQALLNLWLKCEPSDNTGLPKDFEPIFNELCDTQVEQSRNGRIVLASKLITLYRVDPAWTEKFLLPLFDWNTNPVEANAVWNGFLCSPRIFKPLLLALKKQFLDTVHHYAELSRSEHQFSAFLTYVALESIEGYTQQDFQAAFSVLPPEGLLEAADTLVQLLEGAGEQRENYWNYRIKPFWQGIWPKSCELITNEIAETLVQLIIVARNKFPDALATLQDWLIPIQHPGYAIIRLREYGLSGRFPNESLHLLSHILNNQSYLPSELQQCLDDIYQATPALLNDRRYRRLKELSRLQNV